MAAPSRGPTVARVDDARAWNGIVTSFPEYDLRQGFEWGELRREMGWEPVRLAVVDDDGPRAAASVLVKRLPGGVALAYAPRGPLWQPGDAEGLAALLAGFRPIARRAGAVLLRVSPPRALADDAASAALARHGFTAIPDETTTWNTPRQTQTLDLSRGERELWSGLRPRLRRYVTAAARKGLSIETTEREADLAAFHRLMENVGRIKGIPVHSFDYYRTLVGTFRRTGAVTLLVARLHGDVAGGFLTVRLGRRAFMLFASVRSEVADELKHHVAPALYWDAIRRACVEGCERADFGASSVHLTPSATDTGFGVYHFKVGLGCAFERVLPFHDLVFRPLGYVAFRWAERRLLPRLWRAAASRDGGGTRAGRLVRALAGARRAPVPAGAPAPRGSDDAAAAGSVAAGAKDPARTC